MEDAQDGGEHPFQSLKKGSVHSLQVAPDVQREKGREGGREGVCVCAYVCIYIYREREREREAAYACADHVQVLDRVTKFLCMRACLQTCICSYACPYDTTHRM